MCPHIHTGCCCWCFWCIMGEKKHLPHCLASVHLEVRWICWDKKKKGKWAAFIKCFATPTSTKSVYNLQYASHSPNGGRAARSNLGFIILRKDSVMGSGRVEHKPATLRLPTGHLILKERQIDTSFENTATKSGILGKKSSWWRFWYAEIL